MKVLRENIVKEGILAPGDSIGLLSTAYVFLGETGH
jgi:hypothetical protein